ILCVVAYRAVRSAGERDRSRATDTPSDPLVQEAPNHPIYEIALALELIHTYSLIHDDLPCMDDDSLRRGRPTTHRVFGVPAATIAGASLIPLACQALEGGAQGLGLEPERRLQLIRTLCRAAGPAGMVGGQWLDLAAEGAALDLAELGGVHKPKI